MLCCSLTGQELWISLRQWLKQILVLEQSSQRRGASSIETVCINIRSLMSHLEFWEIQRNRGKRHFSILARFCWYFNEVLVDMRRGKWKRVKVVFSYILRGHDNINNWQDIVTNNTPCMVWRSAVAFTNTMGNETFERRGLNKMQSLSGRNFRRIIKLNSLFKKVIVSLQRFITSGWHAFTCRLCGIIWLLKKKWF